MPDSNVRRVYSTDGGRVRPPAEAHPRTPSTRRSPEPLPNDGFVRIRRETSGRGGKTVTTIAGVPGSCDDLAALLKTLKALCGAGGTIEDGVIVIQGDHRDRVRGRLESLGHRVKFAGG